MPSLARSLELNHYLKNDIRTRIPSKIGSYTRPIAMDVRYYTGYNFLEDSLKKEISTRSKSNKIFDENNPLESQTKVCTFITSSFIYERYLRASQFSGQGSKVYEESNFYQSLFDLPFKDINPDEPSYSFVNPTLRAINLCSAKPIVK